MNLRCHEGDGGIWHLVFDRPQSSANVFDVATLRELDAELKALASNPAVRGLILLSGKPKIFLAGADLHSIAADFSSPAIERMVVLGQSTFDHLQALPFPTVAAVHGACLGGGCEMALACDWIVLSSGPETRIGLPETTLGLIPGWGGTYRLPRRVGLQAALDLIVSGKALDSQRALRAGLADVVVPAESLLKTATDWIARGKAPARGRRGADRWLASEKTLKNAREAVLARTGLNYPAPLKAIEVCGQALKLPPEAGLALERAGFIALTSGVAGPNLLRGFLLQERAKKLALIGASQSPQPVRRMAVIGAGVMGAGIAQWAATRGVAVTLRDLSAQALAKGLSSVGALLDEAVKRRSLTATAAQAARDRIVPVDHGGLHNAELILEAAVERLEVKRSLFAGLEVEAPASATLATNTSALSIDDIASGMSEPSRLVGIHFFNPVGRMALVEIVRGRRTSDTALAAALAFVKAIGKLPVLVTDRPGFLVNRVLLPYLIEGTRLFEAGATVSEIDRPLTEFGMPMGPLRLTDEVGVDVAEHVGQDLKRRLAVAAAPEKTWSEMLGKGWLGRKSGRGFYAYGGQGAAEPNLELPPRSAASERWSADAIRERLVLAMINEAARCLEENVVAAPEDVDFALINGTGWAPFRGGPLRYADTLGSAEIVRRLQALTVDCGPSFEPCAHLRRLAEAGAGFYSTS